MSNVLNLEPTILEDLFKRARLSERKRAFHVLRSSDKGEIPAIMFDVLLPGTYVRPHKHPMNDGREIWIPISGRMKVIIFNDDGTIKESYYLSSRENIFLETPSKTFHTVIALEPSVLCELYLGKYDPLTYKEFALWAPEEDNINYKAYLQSL